MLENQIIPSVPVKILVSALSGEPGIVGKPGPAGSQVPRGIQGESGQTGVSYIRWD